AGAKRVRVLRSFPTANRGAPDASRVGAFLTSSLAWRVIMNNKLRVSLTKTFVLSVIAAAAMLAAGCGSGGKNTLAAKLTSPGSPSASPTPGATPSPSPTPGPSPTPTPGPSPTPVPTPTPTPTPGGPQRGKVVVVVEENHGYSSVIGSSAMPYLNS